MEIKALASRLLVEDEEWIESARRRMIAGQAPHLEIFFLTRKFGRPKDVDHTPDRPPILFISQYGQPGDYDPLARRPDPPVEPKVIAEQPATPVPPHVPHGAVGANDYPSTEGEAELVVVRRQLRQRRAARTDRR